MVGDQVTGVEEVGGTGVFSGFLGRNSGRTAFDRLHARARHQQTGNCCEGLDAWDAFRDVLPRPAGAAPRRDPIITVPSRTQQALSAYRGATAAGRAR